MDRIRPGHSIVRECKRTFLDMIRQEKFVDTKVKDHNEIKHYSHAGDGSIHMACFCLSVPGRFTPVQGSLFKQPTIPTLVFLFSRCVIYPVVQPSPGI